MKKWIALLLALVLMLSFAACGQEEEEPAETTEETTEAPENLAPDFTVYDRAGNPVTLSEMRGKPVILNFWATWCGPCKSELPAFQQAYENYGDDVCFMIVDLVSGREETKAGAMEYLDAQGYTFPAYFDEDQQASMVYNLSAIPATVVINAKGEVVDSHVGAMDYDALEALLQQVL